MRKSFRWKMRFVFGLLCLVILLQGLLSLVFVVRINRETRQLVEYKNMAEEIGAIVSSHYSWLSGFTLSAFTDEEFTGSLDYQNCSLGRWLRDERVTGIADPAFQDLLQKAQAPHRAIHENAASLMQRREEGAVPQAEVEQIFHQTKPLSLETIDYLEQMQRHQDALADAAESSITTYFRTVLVLIVGIFVLSVATAVVSMILLIRNVVPPLLKMTDAAERLAGGSTDVDVQVASQDEIGRLSEAFSHIIDSIRGQVSLAEAVAGGDLTHTIAPRSRDDGMSIALNSMVERLGGMFTKIRQAADQVSGGAGEISSGAQLLAQGATEQSSTMDAFSDTIQQVAHGSQSNLEVAQQASSLGEQIKAKAEAGSAQMDRLIEAVGEINRSGTAIENVIKVIDDIAFQTNILALNAAVEAARAGQHGKGFAVVADEVRNLAAKSAEAARDSTALISASIEKAAVGMRIAGETSASLAEIVSGIGDNDRIVSQIADASARQTEAIAQLGEHITQVTRVVQQNSATSEELAAASQQLSAQAADMKQLLAQFRLGASEQAQDIYPSDETAFSLS